MARWGSRRSSGSSTEGLELVGRYEELRDAALSDPVLGGSVAGELIDSEIEIRSGRGERLGDALEAQREHRRRLFSLAAAHGVVARRHRDPPVGRLPRPAHHQHRALPPARSRPRLRRLAQQHLLAPRPRGGAGRRPGGDGMRPPAAGAAHAARRLGQLAVPRGSRHPAGERPQPDVHADVPALRDPRGVRELGGVRGLHRFPRPDAVDRRVHAGVVVDPPPFQLRHRRGPDLRRPADRRRSPRRSPA